MYARFVAGRKEIEEGNKNSFETSFFWDLPKSQLSRFYILN